MFKSVQKIAGKKNSSQLTASAGQGGFESVRFEVSGPRRTQLR